MHFILDWSKLNLEKEKNAAATHEFNTLDAYSNFKDTLQTWRVSAVGWTLQCELPEVVAQACPCGASIAFKVWRMFHTLEWKSKETPASPGDFGISWYELAFYFAIFTGHVLPIWISSKSDALPRPYTFDSPEAQMKSGVYGIKQGFFVPLCANLKIRCNVTFTPATRKLMQAHWCVWDITVVLLVVLQPDRPFHLLTC